MLMGINFSMYGMYTLTHLQHIISELNTSEEMTVVVPGGIEISRVSEQGRLGHVLLVRVGGIV
jgi:hypothetical protein